MRWCWAFVVVLFACSASSAQTAGDLIRLGDEAVARQDYKEGVARYNEALYLDPNSAAAYHKRGLAHYYGGGFHEAIVDLTEAIRLKPADAESYRDRGSAHFADQQWENALADYSEALRLNP